MTRLVKTRTTTIVTEEVELVPAATGSEIGHRYLTVCGYGEYCGADGRHVVKPHINLNAKWLAEAGFDMIPIK